MGNAIRILEEILRSFISISEAHALLVQDPWGIRVHNETLMEKEVGPRWKSTT
jgi:hypothetical protein